MATKGSTTQRGYGARHQAERKRLAPIVARGGVNCARCGDAIVPPEPWDLGHNDERTEWTGPEHRDCNRADGARKRNAGHRYVEPRPWIRPEREW
jgi:hypothetical protein